MTSLPQELRYSYDDLLEWDESIRYELYEGIPVAMAAPSIIHQEISGGLHLQLGNHLLGKPCRVYYAPCDVRLFEEEGDRPKDVQTVLQPDLLVVCDRSKIDKRGIRGAPDLVIEILSDSTRRIDRLTKLGLYQRAGVREYWIVDPDARTVSVHTLKDGAYEAAVYPEDSTVPVGILEGCTVDLRTVFPAP